jgi:hypothetical protein
LGILFVGLDFAFNKNHTFEFRDLKFDRNLLFLSAFFVFFSFISVFFSNNLGNSFLIFEFFILYLLLIFELVNFKLMIKTFLGAVLFASVLGLFQFILQHSLGLKILGESVVSNSMVGVAKLQLFDFKLLRAYGTFAHPNIFLDFTF